MKKNLIHIGLFTCCLLGIVPDTVNAQSDPCGFEAAMQSEFLQNLAYETIISQLEQNPGQGAGPVSGIYEIPTVVHIIHNNGAENISDAQVSDAIAQANHQLAGGEGGFDTKIKLVLARVDPDGNCTNGINRIQYSVPDADLSTHATDITLKNLSRWNPSNFMNIWIVRTILPGSSVTGYAYFPGVNPLLDGLVIKHSFFGNTGTATGNQTNTLVHEFGHYACLYHVWGPSPATCAMWCHEEENCHVRGDRVCDTDPCIQATSTFDCHEPSSCETYSFCSEGFPVGVYFYPKDNYMSYSHSCQDRFTEGQAERMYSFLNNAIRANLWSEENRQCTGIAGYYRDNIIIDSPSTPVSWTVTSLPDNGNILISGNLTIEEATTLTIDPDVVVRFCSNGRLIIKPGATLHLYGTLTNSCGTPWKGVEVWGNSAYSQYTVSGVNRQGRLAAYPGSVIENADIGVQLWGPDYNANAGGIISCSGTTLRNNRRGVEFAPYHNFWPFQTGPTGQPQNYSASFVRCTFVTGIATLEWRQI